MDELIDRRVLEFILRDWLDVDRLYARAEFADHSPESTSAMLDVADRVARTRFLPHYKDADRQEPRLENGVVRLLPQIEDALGAFAEAGLSAAPFPERFGGLNTPNVVYSACMAHVMAANIATAAYAMLTTANARLLCAFGSEAQVGALALPQIAGEAFGTMCLSEPQAGSSLADIATRAAPDGEDPLGARYRLTGTKMWISGGDHQMGHNIIHLVLAKIVGPDGVLPAGTQGISLFATPRRLADGQRNDIVVAGLNHKMGYRGTVNCLLNFGEGAATPNGAPGAVGYLIGQPGQGLAIMFHMMNEARIAVGLGAAALACRGFALSRRYARERLQGRPPGQRDAREQAPLVAHADVRRMLLAQKAYAEGALSLVLFCAMLVDDEKTAPTEDERGDAGRLLGLLTPLAKTWPSEWGLAANDLAIQIHGGYGYTRDFDVEQLYRDNRLNAIHEGTTGIQAADLLDRKILRDGGRGLALLGARVADTVSRARQEPTLSGWAHDLETLWAEFSRTILILAEKESRQALPHAGPVQSALGHLVLAWIWLDQCVVAVQGGPKDPELVAGLTAAANHFFAFEGPRVRIWSNAARNDANLPPALPDFVL